MQEQQTQANNMRKTTRKLLLVVLLMFGFGFAMVPLYDVFCDITGLNGKTKNQAAEQSNHGIDYSRTVTVQFISRTSSGMPWQFQPMINEIRVHPGEVKVIKFYAKNQATFDTVGQAVPSVSPGQAAVYFQKIECFCFNQQPLKAQDSVEMALQFYIDRDLPQDITTLTLSYTLYDITPKVHS